MQLRRDQEREMWRDNMGIQPTFDALVITGAMNQHPRSAMKWMKSEMKDNFVAFYENITDSQALE